MQFMCFVRHKYPCLSLMPILNQCNDSHAFIIVVLTFAETEEGVSEGQWRGQKSHLAVISWLCRFWEKQLQSALPHFPPGPRHEAVRTVGCGFVPLCWPELLRFVSSQTLLQISSISVVSIPGDSDRMQGEQGFTGVMMWRQKKLIIWGYGLYLKWSDVTIFCPLWYRLYFQVRKSFTLFLSIYNIVLFSLSISKMPNIYLMYQKRANPSKNKATLIVYS